jgi:hypothetical protein
VPVIPVTVRSGKQDGPSSSGRIIITIIIIKFTGTEKPRSLRWQPENVTNDVSDTDSDTTERNKKKNYAGNESRHNRFSG